MGYNIHYLKLQETKDSNLKVNIYIFMTGYIYDLKIRIRNLMWREVEKNSFVRGKTVSEEKFTSNKE